MHRTVIDATTLMVGKTNRVSALRESPEEEAEK